MDGGLPGATELAGRLTSEAALCIAPPSPVVHAIIDELYGESEGRPTRAVRILCPDARIESVFGEFDRASKAAELVEQGSLSVRAITDVTQRVSVTDDTAYAHIRVDGEVRSLSVEAETFTESVRDTYERQWDASRPVDLPAPARSRFLATFADEFPAAADTLEAVLDGETAITINGELDPVTVVTLIAARHGIQTIELSDWAEGIGFSSRTELSRITTRLTDRGLIDTERVPHGVGRPRQRLDVAVTSLADCPPGEFLSLARRLYHGEASEEIPSDSR